MALNQKQTQLLVGGILIGVLATLGLQWGMGEYQNKQAQKGVIAFMQGYQNAADKQAFVHGYDWNGDGLAVNLSTSSADEGDDNSKRCEQLGNDIFAVMQMYRETYKVYYSSEAIGHEAELYNSLMALKDEVYRLEDERSQLNCFGRELE